MSHFEVVVNMASRFLWETVIRFNSILKIELCKFVLIHGEFSKDVLLTVENIKLIDFSLDFEIFLFFENFVPFFILIISLIEDIISYFLSEEKVWLWNDWSHMFGGNSLFGGTCDES